MAKTWSRRALAALLLVWLAVLPARAEDYETVLAQLGQLQGLAGSFISESGSGTDAIDLTLAYTRTGTYNTDIWNLTAGGRDPEFENYVAANAPDLIALQGMGTTWLPNGQAIDFGHLLAAMQLVHKGVPIVGSWGGDCMQLVQAYSGQAADSDGYRALMAETFAIDDDGSVSRFGDQDLRADLDAVVLGAQLSADTDLAGLLRGYYEALNDHDRVYQFIALSYGSVNTGDQASFRQQVYDTLIGDTGMQLLLYMNGMWLRDGWQLDPAAEPALRAASDLFADHLAAAVGGESVHSSNGTRMVTMAGQALVDALNTLGDSEAAASVTAAMDSAAAQEAEAVGRVESMVAEATQGLRGGFKLFRAVLIAVGAFAGVGFIVCLVMVFVDLRRAR